MVIEIAENRARMAHSGAISIKSLTLKGMEKSLSVVLNGLQYDVLHKCLRVFTNQGQQAATEAETAYDELVKETGAAPTFSQRKMLRKAKTDSENVRVIATKIKAITIPQYMGRPMSRSYKSRP